MFFAQINPDLELTTGGGDISNGPATTTTVTFSKNSDNPTGSTYSAYNISGGLTATYTLQNFTAAYQGTTISGGNSVSFGHTAATVAPRFQQFIQGAPSNTDFTSSTSAAGTGIITNGTAATNNYGVNLKAYTSKLNTAGVPRNGRVKLAELKILFSRPVNNPILQITGLGGTSGTAGFSAEFTLNSTLSSAISSIARLSGSSALVVSGLSINNGASALTATGAGMAAGSVRINGSNITTVVLDIYVRGDGVGTAASWGDGTNADTTGDGLLVGFTATESDLSITKTVDVAAPVAGNNVVFTITAVNNGASNNTNVSVQDLLPSGLQYVSHTAATGTTYVPGSGVWTIGNLNDGSNVVLTVTAKVLNTGNYQNTAVVTSTSGISDPTSVNNTGSVTLATICYNLPNTGTAGVNTRHGITVLKRAGADNGNWPMVRKSAFTALESNTKGFVITRATTVQISNIVSPQDGMMAYDTDFGCLKLYDGTAWSCFSTPTCP
ncbi:DUF11 domain-containing protein [Halpernia frigidisoli]|nr:DUF11 domain-containing protein [Halpernia frigidisoli]